MGRMCSGTNVPGSIYFAWNNWGNPIKPRPVRRILHEYEDFHIEEPCTVVHPEPLVLPDLFIPDIGSEVDAGQIMPEVLYTFKSMLRCPDTEISEQPTDHDYIQTAAPKLCTVSTQTDMSETDIEYLEQQVTTLTQRLADLQLKPEPVDTCEEVIKDVIDSDERVNFYTGLDSQDLLHGLWDSIEEHTQNISYWKGSRTEEKKGDGVKSGRKRVLKPFAEFIMTLIRIRLNLPLLLLADMFGIGAASVTEITLTWINFLHQTLYDTLVVWPSQDQVRERMPKGFRTHFPNTRVVIDCSEFFVTRPGNKDDQYRTFSQYKQHSTYKCLFGISPLGQFTFVSDLWGGNCSDKYLTENSGLVEQLDKGDEVMADRGFRIEDLLLKQGAKLVAPPFTRKYNNAKGKRLNVKEIRYTRLIARFRIHIERAIQRVKTFRILQHTIPHTLKDVATRLVQLVSALCNLKGPLFFEGNDQLPSKARVQRRKPVKRLQKK